MMDSRPACFHEPPLRAEMLLRRGEKKNREQIRKNVRAVCFVFRFRKTRVELLNHFEYLSSIIIMSDRFWSFFYVHIKMEVTHIGSHTSFLNVNFLLIVKKSSNLRILRLGESISIFSKIKTSNATLLFLNCKSRSMHLIEDGPEDRPERDTGNHVRRSSLT